MAAVQVAQAQPPDESSRAEPASVSHSRSTSVSTSQEAARTPTQQLTLEETLRIMDVATTLRKEQSIVEQQLNIEETKAMLRKRLLAAAQVTGERLTEEQVDIAIEHYYDKLHVFKKPKWSLNLAMAHLYVMRGTIVKWAVAIGATAGVLSWLW